jgi:hypothetical protein
MEPTLTCRGVIAEFSSELSYCMAADIVISCLVLEAKAQCSNYYNLASRPVCHTGIEPHCASLYAVVISCCGDTVHISTFLLCAFLFKVLWYTSSWRLYFCIVFSLALRNSLVGKLSLQPFFISSW